MEKEPWKNIHERSIYRGIYGDVYGDVYRDVYRDVYGCIRSERQVRGGSPTGRPMGLSAEKIMTSEKNKRLRLFANRARQHIVRDTHAAKSGHPGGSLSAIDYMTYLYNEEMRVDPKNPQDPDRDRFVLSKGHCAPGLYAVLGQMGFFPEEDLITLRKPDSYLQGHPNMNTVPGVDFSTGSLGQGVSAAAGMANAARLMKKDLRVYALLGDGEVEEGLVWEAAAYAAHYKLDNLCIAVDVNGLQIDGATKDVMNMEPLDQKFASFGWNVVRVADGNDFGDLEKAFAAFHAASGSQKPTVLLLHTVKGLGVSYMENAVGWHGKAPNDEELAQALSELEAARRQIEAEEA